MLLQLDSGIFAEYVHIAKGSARVAVGDRVTGAGGVHRIVPCPGTRTPQVQPFDAFVRACAASRCRRARLDGNIQSWVCPAHDCLSAEGQVLCDSGDVGFSPEPHLHLQARIVLFLALLMMFC